MTGGILLASTQERFDWLKSIHAKGRYLGMETEIISPSEAKDIMPLIDIANVACGFHASDPNHLRKTVELAKIHNVRVGAHPSLPDLQGFGRREMKLSNF